MSLLHIFKNTKLMIVYSCLLQKFVYMPYFVFERVPLLLSQPSLKKIKYYKTTASLMKWQDVCVCVMLCVCDLCIYVPITLHIFVLVHLQHTL